MSRYFIAANVWLVLGVAALLGCTNRSFDPHGPPMSSFLNGPTIESSSYTLIVAGIFAVSAVFFVLTWSTRKNHNAQCAPSVA